MTTTYDRPSSDRLDPGFARTAVAAPTPPVAGPVIEAATMPGPGSAPASRRDVVMSLILTPLCLAVLAVYVGLPLVTTFFDVTGSLAVAVPITLALGITAGVCILALLRATTRQLARSAHGTSDVSLAAHAAWLELQR